MIKDIVVGRDVTSHRVSESPALIDLEIRAVDEPGPGGAYHRYELQYDSEKLETPHAIIFQEGPIREMGQNGVTNEALLAIVAHRLDCFQAGPFACRENQFALKHTEIALRYLKDRTRDRVGRDVEGLNKA